MTRQAREMLDRLPFTSEYPEHDALIPIPRVPAHPSMIPSREESLVRMIRVYHENTTLPDHLTAKLLGLEQFAQSGVFATDPCETPEHEQQYRVGFRYFGTTLNDIDVELTKEGF